MAITANRTWVTGEVVTAAEFNAFSDDLRAWKGSVWTQPVLASGYAVTGGTIPTPAYAMFGKTVKMRGAVLVNTGTATDTTMFTLPLSYRPAERLKFICNAGFSFGGVDVLPTGDVHWWAGPAPPISVYLGNVSYPI